MESPAEFYRTHLANNIVSWWLEHGPDAQSGGVFTCWNNTGTQLVSTDKYMWSQGRWTWLMAHLAMRAGRYDLGAPPHVFKELAVDAGSFIRDFGIQEDGSTAYVVDRGGRVITPKPGSDDLDRHRPADCFADMFAALGFAGLGQLTGRDQWIDLAEDRLTSVTRRIQLGEFRTEPYPIPDGYSSLAVPMITLGVAEQVHRATGSDTSRQLVASSLEKLSTIFQDGVDVRETVPIKSEGYETLLTRHRNPGHVLELVWFLHHARDLVSPDAAVESDRLRDVSLHFCRIGWDPEYGGLYRFTDKSGGAPSGGASGSMYESEVRQRWDAKLWWPHVEALYATALLSQGFARDELAEWHERVRDYTFATFPDGEGREWVQSRNRDGSLMGERIGLPVKDPFHVSRALMLLTDLYSDETN